MALLIAGLADHRRLRAAATEDRLHQRYRASLFPEAEILLSGLVASGALASSWSGAGPSIVAICTAGTASRIAEAGAKLLAAHDLGGRVLQLAPDFAGAQLIG